MLVSEPKYSFLKELGIGEVNDGVYDGKWFGSGEVSDSLDASGAALDSEVQYNITSVFCGQNSELTDKGIIAHHCFLPEA